MEEETGDVHSSFVVAFVIEFLTMLKVYCIALWYFTVEVLSEVLHPTWKKKMLSECKNVVATRVQPRIAVVTGADGTIGREVVRLLLSLGYEIYALVGHPDRAKKVFNSELKKKDQIHIVEVDFTNMTPLWQTMRELAASLEQVDLVVCCAGVMLVENQRFWGYEAHVCVNVLGQAIVVRCMEEKLQENGRILFMSSACQHASYWNEELLKDEHTLLSDYVGPYQAYSHSKLIIAIYGEILAKQRNISVLSCHPGVVAGGLYQRTNIFLRTAVMWLGPLIARSPEFAALLAVHTALRPDASAGAYYENGLVVPLKSSISQKERERVYELVELVMERHR